ncbi:MAG: glycine zipper 2TM domain-containing protein [Alphaproteobacteria bacterium]|nr:glycine zipper 2TM domain-containing protein [Alphaproteobacteria bacterium]
MPNFKILTVVVAIASMLAACGPGGPTREETGLGIGALAGGLIGNSVGRGGGRVAATVVGAVIGGIVGSEIGRSMDRRDRMLAEEAEYDALERGGSGRARVWRNEDSGHYGEIVPSRPYRRGDFHCRDYEHTVYISGRPETMRGTACRNPDGTWRAV